MLHTRSFSPAHDGFSAVDSLRQREHGLVEVLPDGNLMRTGRGDKGEMKFSPHLCKDNTRSALGASVYADIRPLFPQENFSHRDKRVDFQSARITS